MVRHRFPSHWHAFDEAVLLHGRQIRTYKDPSDAEKDIVLALRMTEFWPLIAEGSAKHVHEPISRIRLSKDSYRPDNVSAHHLTLILIYPGQEMRLFKETYRLIKLVC